jgi:hypothetical protein
MNSFKRNFAIAATVLILGSLLTLISSLSASAQGGRPEQNAVQNVNVVNRPLPTTVQGTATITGDVTVGNTPDQPIPVVEPVVTPFQFLRIEPFEGSSSITLDFGSPAAGQLLILEQLSVIVSTNTSADVAAVADLEVMQAGSLAAVHRIVLTRQDFGPSAAFLANARVLAFVNGNQTLHVKCFVTPAPQAGPVPGCSATLAGRFVDQ